MDIVVINHGIYVIELGANMDSAKADEHYHSLCQYVQNLSVSHNKDTYGVLINFSTDRAQCDYFPTNKLDNIWLLNVHVHLSDPSGNIYYLFEPVDQRVANLNISSSGGGRGGSVTSSSSSSSGPYYSSEGQNKCGTSRSFNSIPNAGIRSRVIPSR